MFVPSMMRPRRRIAVITGAVLSITTFRSKVVRASPTESCPVAASGKGGGDSLSSKRRVLITGASGLLGRQVVRVFEEKAWTIRGLAFSRTAGSLVKCDIFNRTDLAAQFAEFQPDIVIHCAAERRPDRLEGNKDYAMKLNVDTSRTVAELAHAHGAWLIYMSTNYVFDGKDAPYAEDAQANPLNVYGESKLMGERAVLQVNQDAAILRVPLLFGPIEYLGESPVTTLLETIRKGDAKLDNWQERYPTSVEDLARVLEALASAYAKHSDASADFSGIFHWQASERHTKYTMGIAIAEIAGLDPSKISPVDTAPPVGSAPRPQFEKMLCTRLEQLLNVPSGRNHLRSDFRSVLQRYLNPFLA